MFNCSSNWLREVLDLPNATITVLFDKISARNLSSKDKSIVIVVSPLNALIDDQINKLKSAGVNCTELRVCGDEVDGAFEEKIRVVPHIPRAEDLQAGKFEFLHTPR